MCSFVCVQAESPPLCPYPTLRTGSPRRMLLSSKHSIYISPHKTGSTPSPTTPRDRIYYYICNSPPNVRAPPHSALKVLLNFSITVESHLAAITYATSHSSASPGDQQHDPNRRDSHQEAQHASGGRAVPEEGLSGQPLRSAAPPAGRGQRPQLLPLIPCSQPPETCLENRDAQRWLHCSFFSSLSEKAACKQTQLTDSMDTLLLQPAKHYGK